MITTDKELRVSKMAENLVGSEIIKLAGEIKAKIAQGEKIFNLTILIIIIIMIIYNT